MNSENTKTRYSGKSLKLFELENGLLELNFDRVDQNSNTLDQTTFEDMTVVLNLLYQDKNVKGLLLSSAKPNFIVGADLAELAEVFKLPREKIIERLTYVQGLINRLEDLPFPTVCEINGLALGGGFEICLATDYRVMADHTYIGQPEVNFGIIPGYGATVRLSRLANIDDALQWISNGQYVKASKAVTSGAVDKIVNHDDLRATSLALLKSCIAGDKQYAAKRQKKCEGIKLNKAEGQKIFDMAAQAVSQKLPIGNKAPLVAVQTIAQHAYCNRQDAMRIEADMVSLIAKEESVTNLVSTFLAEQQLDRRQKKRSSQSPRVKNAAVLGAGIMGGGIAYQSALTKTPIYVKDIDESSLAVAVDKAKNLTAKLAKKKGLSQAKVDGILNLIKPVLSYDNFDEVDLVVEAVTEKLNIKSAVLKECENQVAKDTVLTSNTSTISITEIAKTLERPENFCGMHFFNPVDKMPLVEIIRGKQSNEATIAKTVAYALSLGKKPIVVNDCAGFLVNRIIFPYVFAFLKLLQEGADIVAIDKAMMAFGWPMGPAFLSDVVGIDVLVHAGEIMSEAYPDRMNADYTTALQILYNNGLLGQKSGQGFYQYDSKTGPTLNKHALALIDTQCDKPKVIDTNEIIERLMLAFCFEAVRCLEDGIVEETIDLDLALIYGIGFPTARGGALRYLDSLGLATVVETAAKYEHLGNAYKPPKLLLEKVAQGHTFIEQTESALR